MDVLAPDDPRVPKRPLWALFLLVLPAVGVVGVLIAYGAMWSVGMRGRAATGPVVELAYSGCAEAGPVVDARLADMGLSMVRSPTPDGFALRGALPADPHAAEQIPATLAVPGAIELRGDGEVLATSADVLDASVRMDLMMVPSVLVKIVPAAADRVTAHERAHPNGVVELWLDGAKVATQANQDPTAKGELELSPVEPLDNQTRWDRVAGWSVVIDHPLPCPITRAEAAR